MSLINLLKYLLNNIDINIKNDDNKTLNFVNIQKFFLEMTGILIIKHIY